MKRFLLKALVWLAGIAVVLFICVSTVLWSPIFSDWRRDFVGQVLSEQIGQGFEIVGDVSLDLGPVSHLLIADARIPSENIDGVNLAELGTLELEVFLFAFLNGRLGLDNIRINDLSVNLITREDRVTSWSVGTSATSKQPDETASNSSGFRWAQVGILDFIHNKTVSVKQMHLDVLNEDNGFELDFGLDDFRLEQLEGGQLVSLAGGGSVNGEPFSISGDFPRGEEFKSVSTFGQVRMEINGVPVPAENGGGYSANVTMETGEIGNLLDVLKLERVLEGRGQMSADLVRTPDNLSVSDIQISLDFDEGESLEVAGDIGNFMAPSGVDLNIGLRLFPEGQPPAEAKALKDIQLTGLTAQIVNEEERLKFARLEFQTNAFDPEFREIGPVSIDRIRRTESGQLSLQGVNVQIGPKGAPFVVADGNVGDLLRLQALDFEGILAVPATLLFPTERFADADALGGLQAGFAINDAAGHLTLSKLDAYTTGTDLWSFNAKASLSDVANLKGLKFNLDLGAPDGKLLLSTLNLKAIETGALGLSFNVEGEGTDLQFGAGLSAGKSQLNASIHSVIRNGAPIVDGSISSERLWIKDIQNAVASAVQLASLRKRDPETPSESIERPEEPLVLEKPEEPLVMPKSEEPLVLNEGTERSGDDVALTDLFNVKELAAKTDLEIAIDITKVEGQQGVSSVQSKLQAKNGKASFGPLEFSYGGGSFSLTAGMNLIDAPQQLYISGSTKGWDIGTLLGAVGIEMDAQGELRAEFNLNGNRASPNTYLSSMNGTVLVSLYDGAIATSLIELAGLGIFPWIFSEELSRGYSRIVCMVAPLNVSSGKVSTKSTVIETERVQMVIDGILDWINETIDLRAEPRPVGKPLARSAWPINVYGNLRNPKIELKARGSRRVLQLNSTEQGTERTPCKPDLSQLQ